MRAYFIAFTHLKDGVTTMANHSITMEGNKDIEKMSEVKAIEKTLVDAGFFMPCVINWKPIIAE